MRASRRYIPQLKIEPGASVMATCGEVLVELLQLYGIDTVFGIPGVHTVELYRGLPNAKIRHITPRQTAGADSGPKSVRNESPQWPVSKM